MHGDFRMLLHDDPSVYAFTRELDGTSLLVVANLSDDAVACDLRGDELVLTNLAEDAAYGLLSPWEARIYRTTA